MVQSDYSVQCSITAEMSVTLSECCVTGFYIAVTKWPRVPPIFNRLHIIQRKYDPHATTVMLSGSFSTKTWGRFHFKTN